MGDWLVTQTHITTKQALRTQLEKHMQAFKGAIQVLPAAEYLETPRKPNPEALVKVAPRVMKKEPKRSY